MEDAPTRLQFEESNSSLLYPPSFCLQHPAGLYSIDMIFHEWQSEIVHPSHCPHFQYKIPEQNALQDMLPTIALPTQWHALFYR